MREVAPARFFRASPFVFAILVALGALLVVSATQVAPTPSQLLNGAPRMANLIERMLRPSFEPGFLMRVTWRTIETLQIAFVGTVIGVLLSLPIAWLASRTLSPIGPFRHV
ncbi:phosphonate ABC transporter, permease protein PhnE, partial [Brucella sp. NBRC 113783]|nr:phosphonate ABC transporter, permease protein PhnE [Brucella sp. NBRC 113783]